MLPGVDIGQPTRQVIVRDQARALAENRLAAARLPLRAAERGGTLSPCCPAWTSVSRRAR
jgi:hypothetical protein